MEVPLYFAYGSNMLLARIEERLGTVERVGVYKLVGWRLDFSAGWFQGVGNLRQSIGSVVEGVLYRLTPDQIRRLDGYEGVPRTYQKFYKTIQIPVEGTIFGRKRIMFAYIDRNVETSFWKPGLPALPYLNLIIDGALQNDLVKTYNELVEFKARNFKLKKGNRHKKK